MGVFYDWSIVSLLEKMTLWAWTWLSSQARFASQNSHSFHKVSMWNMNIRLPWSEFWNCTLNQNMEISLTPVLNADSRQLGMNAWNGIFNLYMKMLRLNMPSNLNLEISLTPVLNVNIRQLGSESWIGILNLYLHSYTCVQCEY